VSASGEGVRGVILMHELPHLSHLAIRSRQEQVIFATCTSDKEINHLVHNLVGKHVRIQASQQSVVVTESDEEMSGTAEGEEKQQEIEGAEVDGGEGRMDFSSSVQVKKADFLSSVGMLGSTRDTCGAKTALCGELRKLSNSIQSGETDDEALDFSVPNGVCLPFGTMELVLGMQGQDATREWEESLSHLDSLLKSNSSGQELDAASERLRDQIEALEIPPSFVEQSVCSHFDPSDNVVARSSANVEDLKGMSGAGLYDSVLHLKVSDPSSVAQGIKMVWASLYTRRAILSRHKAGIQSQSTACMAVLVQKMIPSEYSFVLHTADPILEEGSEKFVYAEVALGLGETLASGKQGTPYRMRIHKDSLQVDILSFANFSSTEAEGAGEVDYSQLRLTKDPQALVDLGTQLCKLGIHLERHFGDAQDIEGALCRDGDEDQLYIVQSRPQF
jgi:phosphoglucan,water dikinase